MVLALQARWALRKFLIFSPVSRHRAESRIAGERRDEAVAIACRAAADDEATDGDAGDAGFEQFDGRKWG